jgi:hypothetical protein
MGQRSKVDFLPPDVRAELDAKLFDSSFSGYEHLERWLESKGYSIGKSSLHRYGSKLEERMAQLKASTQQARALVAASPDDAGDMAEATMRLMTEKLFTLLMEVDLDPESADLGKLAKAMAPLARAQIALRRYKAEVQAKLEEAAKRVQEAASAGGMGSITPDQLAKIREIYVGAVAGPPGA